MPCRISRESSWSSAMVALYADGKRLGEWSEDDTRFLQAVQSGKVEFRDKSGNVVARVTAPEPFWPGDPSYTYEDAVRDSEAPGGKTLDEIWKELGAK